MKEPSEEIKELKEKLLFLEQLAIMGKLILCSAHELNTIIEDIRVLLSKVQDKESDYAAKERYHTEALESLAKMSLIIKSLLSYKNTANNLRP